MRGELIVAVQKEQAMSLGVIATVTVIPQLSHCRVMASIAITPLLFDICGELMASADKGKR
jgi:hypothetical protein